MVKGVQQVYSKSAQNTQQMRAHASQNNNLGATNSPPNPTNHEFLKGFTYNANVSTELTNIADNIAARAEVLKAKEVPVTANTQNISESLHSVSNKPKSTLQEIDIVLSDWDAEQAIRRYFPPTALARTEQTKNTFERQVDQGENPPSLTLLDGTKLTFPPNTTIRNGIPYNGKPNDNQPVREKYTNDEIPSENWQIKDGAFSLGINRFRKPGIENRTETQKILAHYLAKKDAVDLQTLIHTDQIVTLTKEQRLQMINDPTRRVFESYYAKYALEAIANNPEILNDYHDFSVKQTQYIKEKFCTKEIIQQFDNAVSGKDFTFDSQLGGFYERIKMNIDTLNILGDEETQQNAKEKLLTIYFNRYLSLALRNDAEVAKKLPADHWEKIYDFFKAPGKGRIELKIADLFRQTDSYAVGILRNFDASPADLHLNEPYTIPYAKDYHGKLTAGKSTRCPDRLEIQDPTHTSAYAEGSYVGELFNEGIGTYINGPSGTILIEHGAIRASREIHADRNAQDINSFLELQGLLFIYIDGGHSMHEITRALKTDVVRDKLVESFGSEDFRSVGDNMFTNQEALEKAAKDTAIFSENLLAKDQVHQQVRDRPSVS